MFRIRDPFAAGKFYESEPASLKKQIISSFHHPLGAKTVKPQKIIAGIVPHDPFSFSGPVATWVYSRLEKTNFIILGDSHNPMKHQFSIMKDGFWKTPLGEVFIDSAMTDKILRFSNLIEHDTISHEAEHSIEVQLPFLQYRFNGDFKFVPILIKDHPADEGFLKNCLVVGESIANAVKLSRGRWTILASSHFTSSKKVDNKIIKSVLKFDAKKLQGLARDSNSLCGVGCMATAVATAKKLKAKKSKLLKYAPSADLGETEVPVGYASIIIY